MAKQIRWVAWRWGAGDAGSISNLRPDGPLTQAMFPHVSTLAKCKQANQKTKHKADTTFSCPSIGLPPSRQGRTLVWGGCDIPSRQASLERVCQADMKDSQAPAISAGCWAVEVGEHPAGSSRTGTCNVSGTRGASQSRPPTGSSISEPESEKRECAPNFPGCNPGWRGPASCCLASIQPQPIAMPLSLTLKRYPFFLQRTTSLPAPWSLSTRSQALLFGSSQSRYLRSPCTPDQAPSSIPP